MSELFKLLILNPTNYDPTPDPLPDDDPLPDEESEPDDSFR